jgi:hypothetical protein
VVDKGSAQVDREFPVMSNADPGDLNNGSTMDVDVHCPRRPDIACGMMSRPMDIDDGCPDGMDG